MNDPSNPPPPDARGPTEPVANPDAADTAERTISLDDFLKTGGFVGTGGQAKMLIQAGDVRVNGEPETRRRRKLRPGDVVELLGQRAVVGEVDQRQ